MAFGNPTPNYSPITSAHIGLGRPEYAGQAQDLFAHMGFGDSTVRGDNAAGSILGQRFVPLLGSRIQSQLLFGNEMELGRQALLRRFIAANSPGGRQSKLDAYSRGVNGGVAGQTRLNDALLKSLGAGSGLRQGVALDQMNRASGSIHDYGAELYSPEYDMREMGPLMQAYAAAQGSDLGEFMGMNDRLHQTYVDRKKLSGSGSLLSGVAPFLGMAASAYINRGQGGGGGGSGARSAGPQATIANAATNGMNRLDDFRQAMTGLGGFGSNSSPFSFGNIPPFSGFLSYGPRR
jgi:hypothetical protein